MGQTQIIAIDAMGGDHGPSVIVPAAIEAIRLNSELQLILVGLEDVLAAELAKQGRYDSNRVIVHPASEVVGMDESPALALRFKRDSSMRVALNLVKEKKAAACVSAGNTGALMATARYVLKTLPGIDRPAIVYSLPTEDKNDPNATVNMLDLGANVDCDSEHLHQFAVMGSVLTKVLNGKASPRVGLLNIGSEAIKGSDTVKQAAEILSNDSALNYIGFVEGNDIYKGKADVVVCDGFVGNVALKASEGVARLLIDILRREFNRSVWTKFVGWLARPMLMVLKHRLDPKVHNGAIFLGLNGIAVKSHGNAKHEEFLTAIQKAVGAVKMDIPSLIREELAKQLR